MKKFSLEEYLAHQEKKVVRRDGKAARIVCTDFQRSNGVFDIIVCFFVDKERELAYSVNTEGRRYENEETEDDIFFADDEKQLSEFEKRIRFIIDEVVDGRYNADNIEDVKGIAKGLLALAREQIIKDGYVLEKKAFHDAVEKVDPEVMREVSESVDAMNEALRLEYEKGRADALKDLPRWRVSNAMRSTLPTVMCGNNGMILYKDGLEVSISDLEKLPGFKEDE